MPFKNRNGKTLAQDVSEQQLQANQFYPALADLMTKKLEGMVDAAFDKEKYPEGKSGKWQARKKDSEGGKARTERRALLVKSGDLRSSIQVTDTRVTPDGIEVVLGTDSKYAQIHNEGLEGKAFGKHSFKMPQRQFMPIEGEPLPADVQTDIDSFINAEMDKIFR